MGVVEVEVEEEEEGQEEVVEVVLEVEEAEVEVVEGLDRTMQTTPMPKGSLPVETRNPLLRQS